VFSASSVATAAKLLPAEAEVDAKDFEVRSRHVSGNSEKTVCCVFRGTSPVESSLWSPQHSIAIVVDRTVDKVGTFLPRSNCCGSWIFWMNLPRTLQIPCQRWGTIHAIRHRRVGALPVRRRGNRRCALFCEVTVGYPLRAARQPYRSSMIQVPWRSAVSFWWVPCRTYASR
jgi:hypothetical protein